MPSSNSTVSRKRTRSTNVSESNNDPEQATSTSTSTAPPKRQRNNPPSTSRTNYALRNRSVASDAQRYNLRPRTTQSQVRLPAISTPHPTIIPRRTRRHIPSTIPIITPQEQPILPVTQPRQYRLVYISDDDDQPTTTMTQSSPTIVNTTFNLVTDDEDDEPRRPQVLHRRTARSTTATR
jgi:hypothetical protein